VAASVHHIPESKLAQCGISLKTHDPGSEIRLRQLLKSPGFTAIAVFTLALAIGVNSAIFALINGVILKPVVPLKPEEVVNVFTRGKTRARSTASSRMTSTAPCERTARVFADVAAVQFALAGIGRDEAMRRSFAFFHLRELLLDARREAGHRAFYTAEESRPNANVRVVVASHGFWKKMGGG
jgi:hypothetical protein